MVKTFTKALFSAAIIATSAFTAAAVDYISVNPVASPANGYVGGPQGNISVYWPGVTLQMDSRDKDVKTPVDPSFVKITVNGNPITINPDALGGGRIYVGAQELEGGGKVDDNLTISLPDMFFFWEGDVTVEILEGAVTSTAGAVNQALTLNYKFSALNYDAIWEPAKAVGGTDVTLVKGEAVCYVYWEGCSDLTINPGANPFYQQANDENNGAQVSAKQYMSIENGKVKFDFTSFGTGSYILCVPDNAIDLGNGTQSGETVYNFRIVEAVVPPAYVSPKPSSYNFFDAFNVVWADRINQPYSLSSPYASENPDSGNLVFNDEGKALFKVSLNNLEDIEILQIAIVEYQEDEQSKNYPNAQLLVTLADFQTEIDGRYSITIPAGVVNIDYNGKSIPNDQIIYTFTLKAQQAFVLPAPNVTPVSGDVTELSDVKISWPGSIGGLDLLNKNETGGDVTVTLDGAAFTNFTTSFEWSSKSAETEGAHGDIFVISFGENLPGGTYVVTVPSGCLNVSDIDKGTLQNEPIVLTYVYDNSAGVGSVSGNETLKIYNLNGVKVGETSDKNDLNNLPAGIYIINGKKVVIK